MSSEYYEHWLEEQDRLSVAEHEVWLTTEEGRAWLYEQEKLRVAMEWSGIQAEKERMTTERARDERERHCQGDNPVEWSAWKRLLVVLEEGPILFGGSDEKPYDFEAFQAEVKPAPPGATYIEQKDPRLPFRPGNLKWDEGAAAGAGKGGRPPAGEPEYISLEEFSRRCGLSYTFVYRAVRRRDLIAVQKGRQWWVKPADYRAWMDRGRAASATPSRPDIKDKVSRHFPKPSH